MKELVKKINDLYANACYDEIDLLKDEIIEQIDELKDSNCFIKVISALFMEKKYDDVIYFINSLMRKEINDLQFCFYYLVSSIAIGDVFIAKSYLRKLNIINSEKVKDFISDGGANYVNIKDQEFNDAIALLLINFIYTYEQPFLQKKNTEKQDLFFQYYEMIDTIYSLGYNDDIVDYLSNIGKMIFENI